MREGFATVVTPEAAEVDLLFDLVGARLVLRLVLRVLPVLLTEWRSVLFPDNGGYICRNSTQAGRAMDWTLALPPGWGRDALREAWAARYAAGRD
ncbi:MAG: hypothetical protein ABF665_13820 [Gluconacetobacter sp.]